VIDDRNLFLIKVTEGNDKLKWKEKTANYTFDSFS